MSNSDGGRVARPALSKEQLLDWEGFDDRLLGELQSLFDKRLNIDDVRVNVRRLGKTVSFRELLKELNKINPDYAFVLAGFSFLHDVPDVFDVLLRESRESLMRLVSNREEVFGFLKRQESYVDSLLDAYLRLEDEHRVLREECLVFRDRLERLGEKKEVGAFVGGHPPSSLVPPRIEEDVIDKVGGVDEDFDIDL